MVPLQKYSVNISSLVTCVLLSIIPTLTALTGQGVVVGVDKSPAPVTPGRKGAALITGPETALGRATRSSAQIQTW